MTNNKPGRPRKHPSLQRREEAGAATDAFLNDLELFKRWRNEVLPKLGGLVKAGASVEEIYKTFSADAAARAVTIALTSPDTGRALTAIMEVLDRSQGKAIAREEVEHRYSRLSDKELDALLESELRGTSAAPAKDRPQ